MTFDYSLITEVDLDGVDTNDWPDFADAFVCDAVYDGKKMTQEQLDILNEDTDFVYDQIMKQLPF